MPLQKNYAIVSFNTENGTKVPKNLQAISISQEQR